jgi:hypothetical protein
MVARQKSDAPTSVQLLSGVLTQRDQWVKWLTPTVSDLSFWGTTFSMRVTMPEAMIIYR